MKTESWMTLSVLLCLSVTISACTPGSPTQNPAASPTVPASAIVTETAAPERPTETASVAVVSALGQEEILGIVRSSLSAFPWRLKQTVLAKATGRTQTSLTEIQSSGRGYNQSVQTVGSETITIESIVIDSTLYAKIIGSPAETYGLVDGQWSEIPPGSPLAQLADTNAVDPEKIAEIFALDFATMSQQSGAAGLVFELVGAEAVNGSAANIYEAKGETFTYRWWIGTDGRFYKTTVDIPEATRTIVVEYDPSISVQAPIP